MTDTSTQPYNLFDPQAPEALPPSANDEFAAEIDYEHNSPSIIAVGITGFGTDTLSTLAAEPSGISEISERIQAHYPDAVNLIVPWDATESATSQLISAAETYPGTPIAVYGHSFGGDSALEVAEALKDQGLEVAVAETIDPVGFGNDVLPENVVNGHNFWSTSGDGVDGKEILGAQNEGIAGTSHTEIDNDPRVQSAILADLDSVVAFSDASVFSPPQTFFEAAYLAESGHYHANDRAEIDDPSQLISSIDPAQPISTEDVAQGWSDFDSASAAPFSGSWDTIALTSHNTSTDVPDAGSAIESGYFGSSEAAFESGSSLATFPDFESIGSHSDSGYAASDYSGDASAPSGSDSGSTTSSSDSSDAL